MARLRTIPSDDERLDLALVEWTEAIDYITGKAVREVVRDFIPTLDDYLEQLDKGLFECMCSGDVEIKFTPEHKVLAIVPMRAMEGYSWAFKIPNVEVEVDGTFEAVLS